MSGIAPVPRTCTEISQGEETKNSNIASLPLREFRTEPAYVLLGDPGSGKSTEFETECNDIGEEAVLISAREFLTFDVANHLEWQGRTIFIDGLDEVRTGYTDSRTPFDLIRNKLDNLGRPSFRISCREADWLGENDQKHLITVSANSQVVMLRLDPLTKPNIDTILENDPSIDDVKDFQENAYRRNLEGLLFNPQSLLLLAKAVAQEGGWPESRLDTFEKACQRMAVEHNEEHRISEQRSPQAFYEILETAGRLCAIQLISGAAGHSLNFGETDTEYLAPDTWNDESPERRRRALASMLFKADVGGDGHFAPVHRHIAEFLAARYLAQLITDGLPASRVISLLVGEDGGVVSGFRGLSAWLAAHSYQARDDLIARDPIGVGLYGDIRNFSTEEKRRLLASLKREVIGFADTWQTASAFVSLASTKLESTLLREFTDSRRDQDHQIFIDLLLRILHQGTPLPDLSPTVLGIVRDDSWWPRVTLSALDAYINTTRCSHDRDRNLLKLLEDIQVGRVSDSYDELLGTILDVLYPEQIPPARIWNYLTGHSHRSFIGRHQIFWRLHLLIKTTDADIPELLDNLCIQMSVLEKTFKSSGLKDLPVALLARGLDTHDIELNIARLYNWLSAGTMNRPTGFHPNDESAFKVSRWLEKHPEVQKKIFLEGLIRYVKGDDSISSAHAAIYRIYGSTLPPDFGLWCLDKAVELADMNPQVSKYLLREAISSYQSQTYDTGLSQSLLFERTHGHQALENQLASTLNDQELEDMQREHELKIKEYEHEQRHERKQWVNYLKSNIKALQNNQANPALLYDIARAYFGWFAGQNWRPDLDPEQKLREFLGEDEDLLQIALNSLCYTIWRADIPTIKDILRIKSESKVPYLAYPILAGMDQMRRSSPEQLQNLSEDQLRNAVALYYSFTVGRIQDSEWYLELVSSSPKLVAEVLVQCAKSGIRNEGESIPALYNLAHIPNHSQVARYSSLPLLRAFPIRCTLSKIEALDYLLWSALQHTDKSSIREVIEEKLSSKSMNTAQKVHWLAAGIVISPETYCHRLEQLVGGYDKRVRHLARFFCPRQKVPILTDELHYTAYSLLIRSIGTSFKPTWANGVVTLEMEATDLVHLLIQRLASLPSQDAVQVLESLLSDAALHHWHDALRRAQDNQRVIYRDATYHVQDIKSIFKTLSNTAPANVADLAALVVDRLSEIAVRIRTGNTDDWRQYWNEDPYGRPETPKNENSCRDALLSDLRGRLPEGVDAQPEGQYANDKRADIRISYPGFNVPVEVKKTTHLDLWSALHNQLIERYTSDPATGGYGVYLVFWFGGDNSPPPPQGKRPSTAQELQERLQATLTEEESRKITVCVVDVQKPEG